MGRGDIRRVGVEEENEKLWKRRGTGGKFRKQKNIISLVYLNEILLPKSVPKLHYFSL